MVHFYDVTMRAVISGVSVVDGLLRLRVCLLTVLVVLCAVDRSSSRDATTERTSVPLRDPSSLTSQQRDSAVTIVFRDIDIKNCTAVDFARREVRRKILQYLKGKKSTAVSTYWTTAAPSTSIVSTVIVTTSAIPDITTASTTTVSAVSPARKRRRRDSAESNCIDSLIPEEDIIFMENNPETDENGNLRISLSIDNEECKGIDLFEILTELNKLSKSDDGLKTVAPVVEIFRGLPPPPPPSLPPPPPPPATTVAIHLPSFRHPSSLTPGQWNSAVTIAFNFNHIDLKNRVALGAIYREVRSAFLDYLNRMIFTADSPAHSTSTGPDSPVVIVVFVEAAARTTATTTPAVIKMTPKTSLVETQTLHATDERKRKRRNSGRRNDTYTENDLHFIDTEPEVDEDGNLRMSLFIDNERFSDLNLYDVAIVLNNSGELEAAAKAPVVDIYPGLPVATLHLGFQLWLPILVVAIVLLPIFIFVCYLRTRNKKSIATREINASAGELTTERMDRLRESRRQRPTDTFQQEICAISSYVEETNTLLFNTRPAGRMWPAS